LKRQKNLNDWKDGPCRQTNGWRCLNISDLYNTPMKRLPQDFTEFLKLLLRHDVRFLIVGGYAVAFHGFARYTGDIDIWIETTATNADKLLEAITEFGMKDPALNKDLLTMKGQVIRMGIEPNRIEILTGISGVVFESCFQKRVLHTLEGMKLPFLSLKDLRQNKKASGRTKDLLDLENLPE